MHICVRTLLRTTFGLTSSECATSISTLLPPTLAVRHRRRPRPQPWPRLTRASSFSTASYEETLKHARADADESASLFEAAWPAEERWSKPRAWVTALEPFLPRHLSTPQPSDPDPDQPIEWRLRTIHSLIVGANRQAGFHLLSHLGVQARRWDAVDWIIRSVLDQPAEPLNPRTGYQPLWSVRPDSVASLDEFSQRHPIAQHGDLDGSHGNQLYSSRGEPLDLGEHAKELAGTPESAETLTRIIPAENLRPLNVENITLDELTRPPLLISPPRARLRHRLLGQIWGGLGHMILSASQRSSEESEVIMTRVLGWIALFQHNGLIPDQVFQYSRNSDPLALNQPPLLYLFSSKIYTALSDINRVMMNPAREEEMGPRWNPLNHPLEPRSKLITPQISSEVWLELVLWTCVHDGWVLEGVGVLLEMAKLSGEHTWSLMCWGDILRAEADHENIEALELLDRVKATLDRSKSNWNISNATYSKRKVSSEVVSAFVDGLVSSIYLGVGYRGANAGWILDAISTLKAMLDRDRLELIGQTWHSIIVRLADGGGLDVEKDPEFMQQVLLLAQLGDSSSSSLPGGHENVTPETESCSAEPTFAPLGLFHRTLRAHINKGDMSGAFRCLQQLQSYTDLNKRKSTERFFQRLRSTGSQGVDSEFGTFISNTSALTDPALHPLIPSTIMAGFIELANRTNATSLVDWLLHSPDVDGPLVPPELYSDPVLGHAILSWAIAKGDKDLMSKVLESQSSLSAGQKTPIIPVPLLLAILTAQIERREWQAVGNLLNRLERLPPDVPDGSWRPRAAALLIREFLRHEDFVSLISDDRKPNLSLASAHAELSSFSAERPISAILRLVFETGLTRPRGAHTELNTLLGMLTSLEAAWARLATSIRHSPHRRRLRFVAFSRHPEAADAPLRLPLKLSTSDFDIVLEGVAHAYGVRRARDFWDWWCRRVSWYAEQQSRGQPTRSGRHRHPAGDGAVRPMPRHRPTVPEGLVQAVTAPTITVGEVEAPVTFRGAVVPKMSTVRVLLRALRKEIADGGDGKGTSEGRRELSAWAVRMMRNMGLSEDDLAVEMSGIDWMPGEHRLEDWVGEVLSIEKDGL